LQVLLDVALVTRAVDDHFHCCRRRFLRGCDGACRWLRPNRRPHAPQRTASGQVSLENAVGLVVAVAVLAYLVYALIAPEKLG
jgi:K+-transporting ATPase KdpF subunit